MKQFIMIAVLAMFSLNAKSQTSDQFVNGTNCDLEYRVICIDEVTCTHTVATTWKAVAANSTVSLPLLTSGTCGAGTVQGYEVRFAPSTGCSGNGSLLFSTNDMNPCGLPYNTAGATLGQCIPCSNNEAGDPVDINIHFSPHGNDLSASY